MARRKRLVEPVKVSGVPISARAFRVKRSTSASPQDRHRLQRVNNAVTIRHTRFQLQPVKHAQSSERD